MQFDYKGTKNIGEPLPEILILHDTYFEHKWRVRCEREEDGIKKEKLFQGNKSVLKKSILSVYAYYSSSDEIFKCGIECTGIADDVTFAFQSMAEAVAIKDKIWKWLLNDI